MPIESHKTQKMKDGYGAAYHRNYSVTMKANPDQIAQALADLKSDLNQFSPQLLARFEKVTGEVGQLNNNDEFLIHITGPWNGPVRVTDVGENEFRLLTLEGHLEAGEIRFSLKKNDDENQCTFTIESFARSRDAVVDLVYDKIPIAKMAQTEMWTQFCKNFAERVIGKTETETEVQILTERFDTETGQWQKM